MIMRELDEAMETGHVIEVHPDGTYTDAPGHVHAPELIMSTDEDGQILQEHEDAYRADAARQGWALLTGYTRQHGYREVCMHTSEFIGGDMEKDILARPGYYVALTVDILADQEPDGWVMAYRTVPLNVCDGCYLGITGLLPECQDGCDQDLDHVGRCDGTGPVICDWCGKEDRLTEITWADFDREDVPTVGEEDEGCFYLHWKNDRQGPYPSAADAWESWHTDTVRAFYQL